MVLQSEEMQLILITLAHYCSLQNSKETHENPGESTLTTHQGASVQIKTNAQPAHVSAINSEEWQGKIEILVTKADDQKIKLFTISVQSLYQANDKTLLGT